MTHHWHPAELDLRARAEHARMALNMFAELAHQGGTNAVADAEGITLVVPDLISCLLHLLEAERLPVGSAIRDALNWYTAECGQEGRNMPDPIGLLRMIYRTIREEGPGIPDDFRLDEIAFHLTDRGWNDYGSPFEP